MKYAFAGDRAISVEILNFIMSKGYSPVALLITEGKNSSHAKELITASGVKNANIIRGKSFGSPESIALLKKLELDYIIGIHFPYLIPEEVLNIPKVGFLNLHPSFLPFNKGWHTPSWAILDDKPYGATLHFMSVALDKGDIIHQKKIEIKLHDTANSLYKKVLNLEVKVFKEAFEDILTCKPNRQKQVEAGTSHNKRDLSAIKKIDLKEKTTYGDAIDKLRALTTNDNNEAAYFMDEDGVKYAIQISFTKIN